MRIALMTYSTRPRGGVVHTLALAEALAARGEDVTVLTLARGGDTTFFRPVDDGVRVVAVPCPDVEGETMAERVVRSIDLLGAAVDPDDYDIVHAQDCISANAAGGRCVRTVHHLDTFTTPVLARCHERAIVEPHTHVCVSHAVAAELRDGWGIEATVIPNGVDAERFEMADGPEHEPERMRWRARLGEVPVLLAVGGIEPRKGTALLPDVVAILRDLGQPVRLVIAGGETLFDYRDYRSDFEERCRSLDVEVDVLGPVDHDELPALVAEADVFAFPSTKEGFGLAAMEALAAGTPVVMRDLPVLREVFGDTVCFAHDASSFAAGVLGALERGRGGEPADAGRSLARSHRWSEAARAHVDLYRHVVDAAPTRAPRRPARP